MTDHNEQKQPGDPEYLLQVIGQRLRRFRESQHLEPAQLAEFMEISSELVEKIEQGKHAITVHSLVKLSEGLGVNPTWLLTGCEHMMKEIVLKYYDLYKYMEVPEVAEKIMSELPQIKRIYYERLQRGSGSHLLTIDN